MSKPLIEQTTGGYRVTWETEQVMIDVSRIREQKGGRVVCYLIINSTAPGHNTYLDEGEFILTSKPKRDEMAKSLQAKYPNLGTWDEMLFQLIHLTLELLRQGEPLEELDTSQDIQPPSFLVKPLIYEHHPNIVFGDGGVGKSQLGLLTILLARFPNEANGLGLSIPQETKGLLLDWETDRDTAAYQIRAIQEGMGLPPVTIPYRRCSAPLIDDIQRIHEVIDQVGAKFIVIDSLGPACGSDLKENQPALAFFTALRQLKVTSLILAHTSKNEMGRKTVFGSVFFQNMARSVWELKKSQETGQEELHIGLFQTKVNLSKLHHPLGFRLCFFDGGTIFQKEDVREVAEFSANMSIRDQLMTLLGREGAMTVKDLGNETGKTEASIRGTLNRFKDKDFVRVDDKWGLLNIIPP